MRRLPSRRGLVIAIGLPAMLAAGVAALGLGNGTSDSPAPPAPSSAAQSGPLALVPVSAPAADSAECATFLAALPDELPNGSTRLPRRPLIKPAPSATMAWGDAGHDPMVVRCGLEKPAELTPTSELLDVSGVYWLRVDSDQAVTWYAVDRAVYIGLTTPKNAGTGPLQEVSTAIGHSLPTKSN